MLRLYIEKKTPQTQQHFARRLDRKTMTFRRSALHFKVQMQVWPRVHVQVWTRVQVQVCAMVHKQVQMQVQDQMPVPVQYLGKKVPSTVGEEGKPRIPQ